MVSVQVILKQILRTLNHGLDVESFNVISSKYFNAIVTTVPFILRLIKYDINIYVEGVNPSLLS